MGRFFVRARRVMLLAVALAVTAALSGGIAAHAANAASSSTSCTFNLATTSCQSTDATVTLESHYSGASACTFTWQVDWADGKSSDVTDKNPADGYVFLAQHTYANAGTYHITVTGQVAAGDCTVLPPGNYYFTLVKPTPTPSASCPPLQFIGIRGSSEVAGGPYQGYGETIFSLRKYLQGLVPGMGSEATNYPAIPVLYGGPLHYKTDYNSSVAKGVSAAMSEYRTFRSGCPQTPVVIAGDSQGVDVEFQVSSQIPQADRAHVIIIGFGDPHYNPNSPVDAGNYYRDLYGLLVTVWDQEPHYWPSGYRIRSYCLRGDDVCNASGLRLVTCLLSCTHETGYISSGYTDDAASWTYSQWRKLS